jgi:hypothetical protein
MSASILAWAWAEMTGPRSASGSKPPVTLSFRARSTSSGSQALASPTNTTVDRAMHRCPAAPKAAPTNWLRV